MSVDGPGQDQQVLLPGNRGGKGVTLSVRRPSPVRAMHVPSSVPPGATTILPSRLAPASVRQKIAMTPVHPPAPPSVRRPSPSNRSPPQSPAEMTSPSPASSSSLIAMGSPGASPPQSRSGPVSSHAGSDRSHNSSRLISTPRQTPRQPLEREIDLPGISFDSIKSPPPYPTRFGTAVGDEPPVVISPEEYIATSPPRRVVVASPIAKTVSPIRDNSIHSIPATSTPLVPTPTPAGPSSAASASSPAKVFATVADPTLPPLRPTPKSNLNTDGHIYHPFPSDEAEEEVLTDDEQRMLLRAQLSTLKTRYPDINLADYDFKNASLKQLHKVVNLFKAQAFARECGTGYKKFLIAAFVIIEVICVRLLHITGMSGLTSNQIQMMSTYDDLMLELGEKYGRDYKSYFPVELRLCFAIGVNSIIFYVLKLVMGDANSETSRSIAMALGGGKTEGGGVSGIIGSVMQMLTGAPAQPAAETLQPPRRRRRGATTNEPTPAAA